MTQSFSLPRPLQDALEAGDIGAFRSLKAITVSGFASYNTRRSIEIHPLTILAGANSAGKSSAIKPLLMLKQTLDNAIDPGPLLISGSNVQFTSLDQVFTREPTGDQQDTITILLEMSLGSLELTYSRDIESGIALSRAQYRHDIWHRDSIDVLDLTLTMSAAEIERQIPEEVRDTASRRASRLKDAAKPIFGSLFETLEDEIKKSTVSSRKARELFADFSTGEPWAGSWRVRRHLCFLTAAFSSFGVDHYTLDPSDYATCNFAAAIKNTIHVPAFRRKHFRNYPPAENKY